MLLYKKAFYMKRGSIMADKDEELEKILKEIKENKNSDNPTESSELKFDADSEQDEAPAQEEAADMDFDEESKQEADPEKEPEPERPFTSLSEEGDAPEQSEFEDEYVETEEDKMNGSKKKIIIIIAAVIAIIAIAAGVYFGAFYNKEEPTTTTESTTTTTTTEAPVIIKNPLTGETDFNEAAVGKRPVAVVVENSPQARPQYNMDTPDIIVEGEVEGGITRMLWLYADMTDLPEQVGPTRSARPSYVEFSQFFDSIFVHFGESHSKGDYTGADDVIKQNNVDNINGMTTSSCFKRTSDKSSPHNAVLVGSKLVSAIENKGYRTDLDESKLTQLAFNDKFASVSTEACNSIKVKVSSRTNTHTLTYSADKQAYVNASDYGKEVSFTNVIVMFADSQYVNKENYKGSGKTETYCNYKYTSGTGKLASGGSVVDFNWTNENGVLKFTNASTGAELKLNPGRTWLCLASQNNGGTVTVSAE